MTEKIKPKYENLSEWEMYVAALPTELRQARDEGLDLGVYSDVFTAVSRLPMDENKKRLGDVLFDVVCQAKQAEGYPYTEPSSLPEIQAMRKEYPLELVPAEGEALKERIHGAWLGRICGCMLGKTIEGVRTDELIPMLKETGNWPLHRYIRRIDMNDAIYSKYKFHFPSRSYVDDGDGMPADDDTNYMVMAQYVVEQYGRDFTPYDMSRAWLFLQGKEAYCTAERVAYCNFIKGYEPPESAIYMNPYREWIGAQIRGDYFGYINPGQPETAADMAFRDASISHIKNGIYGEMFIAAMLAVAACTDSIKDIILRGLAEIPHTSRLYEAVMRIVNDYSRGIDQSDCLAGIHTRWDEHSSYDWCHTISNAEIVTAALLYGEGNYSRSICMAVETGFDTDCNGATVGSIIGMAKGRKIIGDEWADDIKNTLHTSIFGKDTLAITDCVAMTMKHIGLGKAVL